MYQNYTFSTTLAEKVVSKANSHYHYGQLDHLNINQKFKLWNILYERMCLKIQRMEL